MCNLSELIEEKGFEKGIEQVALNMLNLDLNIDMIIQCTGLSKERIEALKQEIGSEKSSLSGMSLF